MMMENEFKVGDHVKCVDATHIPQLVHGREYIVASGNNGKVVVQDIAGVRYGEIEMSRFEKV